MTEEHIEPVEIPPVRINMNQMVRVQVYPEGVEIMRKHHENSWRGVPNALAFKAPKDGFVKMPLWEFAKVFGPHFKLGYPPSICLTIEVFP